MAQRRHAVARALGESGAGAPPPGSSVQPAVKEIDWGLGKGGGNIRSGKVRRTEENRAAAAVAVGLGHPRFLLFGLGLGPNREQRFLVGLVTLLMGMLDRVGRSWISFPFRAWPPTVAPPLLSTIYLIPLKKPSI